MGNTFNPSSLKEITLALIMLLVSIAFADVLFLSKNVFTHGRKH